jgi:serine-type D-Ala-D-Ala carboxypeptidase/endopeptidase (penicillin-binding protein 4)
MQKYVALIFSILLFSSCKNSQALFNKSLNKSEIFNQNFAGFTIVDLSKNKTVFEKNADRYFQPASNTKLITFYAGLKLLGNSVPALKYIVKGDSLIFWGTGDPSFLNPALKNTVAFDFLKNRTEKLYFSDANNKQSVYGSGWQIDDINEDYQAEINSLPLYGNLVTFTNENNNLKIMPTKAAQCLNKSSQPENQIVRGLDSNCFGVPDQSKLKADFMQEIPFKTSTNLIIDLLADTLKRQVFYLNRPLPKNHNTFYSGPVDSLYKRMLHVSDNMIAEQLLLMTSSSVNLNSEQAINKILSTVLADLPDKPRWVDGSGLSRYNLITPRSLVKILQKTYQEIPEKRLFDLLTEGGKTGNLKSMFKNQPPFVYAKTGSFSNNYNLSGYLIGASGKRYAFSFMNNNFVRPMADIRKEVERILVGVRPKL